jgi:hypothetical protein
VWICGLAIAAFDVDGERIVAGARRYGFELVTISFRTEATQSIEYLRRITSIGFFTNFLRFARNPNTRRLLPPVILIAIARPIATGR